MRCAALDSDFGRGMHAARFQGSVVFITAEEARGDASLWYPTGSVFTGRLATPEDNAIYSKDDVLP